MTNTDEMRAAFRKFTDKWYSGSEVKSAKDTGRNAAFWREGWKAAIDSQRELMAIGMVACCAVMAMCEEDNDKEKVEHWEKQAKLFKEAGGITGENLTSFVKPKS